MILQSPPYGDEKIWNALRLAKALTTATVGMKVKIFLLGDGVTAAKKGQKPPEGFYNIEKMLTELAERGVEIVACRTCLSARGLTQEDMLQGARVGTTSGNLVRFIEESQKVLSI